MHDFFQSQTTQVGVFLFQRITHDWTDKQVRLPLATVRAGLRPGFLIAIMEMIIPAPGTEPLFIEWIRVMSGE